MKLAFLSESPADEAALCILVGALLGVPVELVEGPPLSARSWQSVLLNLPKYIRHLHYHTDAEGLVAALDSDVSPVHDASHAPPPAVPDCRMCALMVEAEKVTRTLTPVPGRASLRLGFGLAVPSIEAWYLCGHPRGVSEFAWQDGLRRGGPPYYVNQLKQWVYGTERPSLALEERRAIEEATRLAGQTDRLLKDFPNGFGLLARQVQNWRTPPDDAEAEP